MITRLQEGNIEKGILTHVRNKFQEGVTDTLFHDRIFWLESNYIENLDYDVRVANLLNTSQKQQFKCITASFNVLGLQMQGQDATRLLGQHF